MSDPLLDELRALRDQVRRLTERVYELERTLGVTAAKPAASAPEVASQEKTLTRQPVPAASPVAPRKVAVPVPPRATTPTTPTVPTAPTTPTATPGESLESRIGRYWLNRIGIGALVLGVAFFILYNIQFFGPELKILTGFVIGGGLMAAGLSLERRSSFQWYGRGLIGGAWALLYFTTYAMYHFEVVKILHSPIVDLALLLIVAGGAVAHAMRYRSQVVTSIAFLLGFLTIGISNVTAFTLVATALLVIAVVGLTIRMRWHGLCLFALLLSYLTYILRLQIGLEPGVELVSLLGSEGIASFWLHTGFLAVFWLGFSTAALLLDEEEADRRHLIIASVLLNAFFFSLLLLVQTDKTFSEANHIPLVALGLAHGILARLSSRRGLRDQSTIHIGLALIFATSAIPVYFTERWTTLLWALEIPLLVWVGLRLERVIYRGSAVILAVFLFAQVVSSAVLGTEVVEVMGASVRWSLINGAFATLAFSLAAVLYRVRRIDLSADSPERHGFHLYTVMAGLMIWQLIAREIRPEFQPLIWSLEAAGFAFLGFRLQDPFLRGAAAVGFLIAGFGMMTILGMRTFAGWNMIPIYLAALSTLVMSLVYRRITPAGSWKEERYLREFYSIAFVVLLTAILWRHVPQARPEFQPLLWSLEAAGFALLGWKLPDQFFRGAAAAGFLCAGFGLLAMLGVRSFSGADTMPSYGVVLLTLVMSQAYRRNSPTGPWKEERYLREFYSIAFVVLLTAILWHHVPGQWLALAWGVEGFVLLITGFVLAWRLYRFSGLSIFALLIAKILFVDLAGAETIYRIVSFIVAGTLLLLASFVYGRFAVREAETRERSLAQQPADQDPSGRS